MSDFEAIIGLECHAQLRTQSKMFCDCPVVPDGAPENTAVCPICLGHPGTLPMINAQAVHLALKAALALSCVVHTRSVFARKHYFYPDLPKGYQITQGDQPLATDGCLHTPLGDVGITRIHLEEDSGKMHHEAQQSRLDWNRAGIPLIETVSAPDIRSPEQAEAYVRRLHRVLVVAGICEGSLEKGQLRCDVNLSMHRVGQPWGTRVEIKNINSFRFVARALRYEMDRQIKILSQNGVIASETRSWDGQKTVLLRPKESAADYRYLVEPDLPPLQLSTVDVDRARQSLPGLPFDRYLDAQDQQQQADWMQRYGLSAYDVGVLCSQAELMAFFEDCVAAGGAPKAMANLLMGDVLRHWKIEGFGYLIPTMLVALQALLDAQHLNREGAKKMLAHLIRQGGEPQQLLQSLGLQQQNDPILLENQVRAVLKQYPQQVAAYQAGDQRLLGFLIGEAMKATQRQAAPAVLRSLLLSLLQNSVES